MWAEIQHLLPIRWNEWVKFQGQLERLYELNIVILLLLGRRQANLLFHFAGSGENLPDITKSRDASLDNDLLALSSRSW